MGSKDFLDNLKIIGPYPGAENRNISKSYTKNKTVMAVCISDTAAVGVDLEEKKTRSPETIKHFVKKFSTFQIKNVPCNVDEQWFYRVWTAMEGYFKLDGSGFSTPKDFIIDLERQVIFRGEETAVCAWFEHFDICDFIICVCSDRMFSKEDVRLSCHGWEDF
jgi:phosphopantetheinyl transferase